ncbi:MAG: hypothetical protein D6812_05830 [Deltaproteobacteria bacterium]|nr:MAG: hypothetical protein D6812_05830 [Deltaproteobacteria bacterium]
MKILITSRPIDQIPCQALALSFFQDERPLQGSTGLIDWRIGGKLSRLLLAQRIVGRNGETLLTPSDERIAAERLFLFGLGKVVDFSLGRYRETVKQIVSTLFRMHCYDLALPLPGVAMTGLGYPETTEMLLVEIERYFRRKPERPPVRCAIVARPEVTPKIEVGIRTALNRNTFHEPLELELLPA